MARKGRRRAPRPPRELMENRASWVVLIGISAMIFVGLAISMFLLGWKPLK